MIYIFHSYIFHNVSQCCYVTIFPNIHHRKSRRLWEIFSMLAIRLWEEYHLFRSSLEVFLEKSVLEICGDFTGKHKCLCVISPTFFYDFGIGSSNRSTKHYWEKKNQFSLMKLFKGFLSCFLVFWMIPCWRIVYVKAEIWTVEFYKFLKRTIRWNPLRSTTFHFLISNQVLKKMIDLIVRFISNLQRMWRRELKRDK